MNAAYRGLDAETREQIDGLHAIHRFDRVFGRKLSEEKRAEVLEKYPPARHPMVRTHPESGLKSLYVNNSFVSHIDGMDNPEGHRLLRRLYREGLLDGLEQAFRTICGS